MADSFSEKTIRLEITLGQGEFSGGGNTKILEGLAIDATVTKPGGWAQNGVSVKVYGLRYEDIAQLTMLAFRPLESRRNTLALHAGDKGTELALVFFGEITGVVADFNTAPDVLVTIKASTGSYPQRIAESPVTTDGEADVDQLMAQFTAAAGYVYKGEGVTGRVKNAWFAGSPLMKLHKLARDTGHDLIIDDGTVIALPAGQARAGEAVLLRRDTGMLGYPSVTSNAITLRCLFNPALQHGGLIKVMESIVPNADGLWQITKLTHKLTAYRPEEGQWETTIEAASYE